jgi:hypothetical protein
MRSGAFASSVLLAGAIALPACREAARELASSPGGAPAAWTFFDALAGRFGPVEREPDLEAFRARLARAALTPSRVFDQAAPWTRRTDDSRALELEGAVSTGHYRIELRGAARVPQRPGDYRGRIQLTRTGDGRYEWRVREALAVGPVRPEDLAGSLVALLRGAEAEAGSAAREKARAALPRTSARLAQLFRLEALDLRRDDGGATAVRVGVRLVPDALRPEAPRYAAFLDRYATPIQLSAVVADASGRIFLTLDAGDNLWTLRARARDGHLVPLGGAAEPELADELQASFDLSTKMGLFRVGVRRLVVSVSLHRGAGERGFVARFDQPPEWQLPFLVKPFLGAPLRYPFEDGGSELRFSALAQPKETLLVRDDRFRVRESWIVRWLGGLAGDAMSEFSRGAEQEADRFTGECLIALRDDVADIVATAAPAPGASATR